MCREGKTLGKTPEIVSRRQFRRPVGGPKVAEKEEPVEEPDARLYIRYTPEFTGFAWRGKEEPVEEPDARLYIRYTFEFS